MQFYLVRCFDLRTFGDKDTFAIRYEFVTNPFNEHSLVGDTWGKFELLISGVDVCQIMRERSVITYQWNLIYIVEWFSENLIYILGDDPFPLPVEGQHSLELLDNSFISELDNDSDFDEWFDIKQNWEFKHSWFSNRAGSFLPVVLFRRFNDEIEIAWSNGSTYSSHGVSFINPTGVKYISFRKFELIITNFIKDFLENLMLTSKNKSDAIKFRQKIINLIK